MGALTLLKQCEKKRIINWVAGPSVLWLQHFVRTRGKEKATTYSGLTGSSGFSLTTFQEESSEKVLSL